MSVGILSIDLEAKLGRLESDLGRANKLLDGFAKKGESSIGRVRDIFAGVSLAGAFEQSIQRAIQLFPQLIEGAAKFQDLAEETGASAVGLARFQTAADVSGVSVETLAGLMVKLTGNLGKINDESKGAGQALGNLGIPLKEFVELSPDEKIKKLAESFGAFADGEEKTSNALALFNKNGAQVLKFFKEYQESGSSAVKLTKEQIEAADRFADSSARAASELRQLGQVLAIDFLPTLTNATARLKSFFEAFGDGKIAGVLAGVQETLKGNTFLDAGDGVAFYTKKLRDLQTQRDVIASDKNPIARRGGLFDIDAEIEKAKKLEGFYRAIFKATAPDLGQTDPRELARRGRGPGTLPRLDSVTAPDPAVAKAHDAAEAYLDTLRKQLQKTEDLTKAEEVLQEIREGRLAGATGAQREAAEGYAIQIDGAHALAESFKFLGESNEAWVRQQLDAIKTSQRAIDEALDNNAALRDEIAIITGGESARREVERSRLEAAINTKEMALSLRELNGASETEIDNLQREIELLRERAGLLGQRSGATDAVEKLNERIKESERVVGGFRNAFEDAFVSFSNNTKGAGEIFTAFTNSVLNNLLRIESEKASLALFGDPAKGISGLFNVGGTKPGGGDFVGPPEHATGLEYVPYDGYITSLHKGERVQTAREASAMRSGRGGNVYITNNGGSQVRAARDGDDWRIVVDAAVAEIDRRISRGGSTAQAIKGMGSRPHIQR